MEHLARLFDDLVLFLVVAVLGHLGVVRENVEGDLVRKHRAPDLVARRKVAGLILELLHGGGARARRRLVGRHDDALHAGGLVDRPHGDRQDGGGAVGVGDDAVMVGEIARIDLGHDQRRVGVHAEGRRIVDHDAARCLGGRHERAAARGAGAEESDVDALEGTGRQLFDLVRFALEFQGLADRARRGEQLQGGDREVPSLEDAEDFHSDRAGGADNGDVLGVHDGRGTYRSRPALQDVVP